VQSVRFHAKLLLPGKNDRWNILSICPGSLVVPLNKAFCLSYQAGDQFAVIAFNKSFNIMRQ
jgi:hypothetical protein